MYLSKLEIIGFKSFAHRTVLRFNDGITAVVGPNGCGKSNIIDAIRWALGEQKPTVLRSDAMGDVIFNGAGKRRPLGMAEVALTIENTKGILPTEFSEVTIARRLFRSGDSEYLLNKTQCRLRDVVDLFMDTGMGANAYSVIELKMIETILSDRADERRRLFEEAAGVTKYKARRREALRRLEATGQDVLRVNDIVKEVSKKVNSLERQAKRAEQYEQFDAERKKLELETLIREYLLALDSIQPYEQALAEARARRTSLNEELSGQENAMRLLEEEQGQVEVVLIEAQDRVNTIGREIANREQEQAVAQERIRALGSLIERAERDSSEASGGIEGLDQDRLDVESALESIVQQIGTSEVQLNTAEFEAEESERELNARRRGVKDSQENVIAAIEHLSDLRTQQERILTRIENIRSQITRFDVQDEETRAQAEEVTRRIHQVQEDKEVAGKRLDEAQQAFENAQLRKAELQESVDSLRKKTIELHNGIGSRRSRVEFLSSLVEQNESVQFLLAQDAWIPEERITVADAVSTDEQYRRAIAAALGDAAEYVIVPTRDDAIRGMQVLESNGKGKATFVCLDLVSALPTSGNTRTFDSIPAIGWANQLCTSAPEYDTLREFLLQDILVVPSLTEAAAAITSGIASRVVTLDGSSFTHDGIMRGGGQTSDEGAGIGKREQIERLEHEAAELLSELQEVETTIARMQDEAAMINLSHLADAVRSAQQTLGQLDGKLSQAEYEARSAEEMLLERAALRQKMTEEMETLTRSLQQDEGRKVSLQQQQENAEQAALQVGAALEEHEAMHQERMRRVNELRLALVGLRSDEKSARIELERISRDRENAVRVIEQRRLEMEKAAAELTQIESSLTSISGLLEELRTRLEEAGRSRDEIIARQTEQRTHISATAEELRSRRQRYDEVQEQIQGIESQINELRVKTATLTDRAERDFDSDLAELVRKHQTAEKGPDDEQEMPLEMLYEQLSRTRDKLKSLGTVNMLAYEEWRQESERLEFLQKQLEDLRKAERTLVETIEEINRTAQTVFIDTFEKIRKNFVDIFVSLFAEGDEADLRLGEGDPLEAQIEIIAKPRGKRPTTIDLLSGGEKTLTAIALLFSIYLVKPSPFCILDEVDAPLDDANIDRFIQLVRRFDKDTQFIIVTHNKRTMSAADTIYGVTQEEDGVSKIVSVRLTETTKEAVES